MSGWLRAMEPGMGSGRKKLHWPVMAHDGPVAETRIVEAMDFISKVASISVSFYR